MTPELIAQRYAQRPGYSLASYGEVGLPVYKIKMKCLVLDEKEIGAIDEFILRAAGIDIGNIETLGRVLGLDDATLNNRLGELIGTDDLAISHDPGRPETVQLTVKGRRVLDVATSVVPQELAIEFDFDGLLRRPIAFVDEWYTPRKLKDYGLREIPPFPTRPPQLEEINIVPLRSILKTANRGRHGKRELLAFRAIERRYLGFHPALALIYRSDGGAASQIAFAVNGRLSSEHEHAFARALAKNRLASAINMERSAEEIAGELLGDHVIRATDRRRTLVLHQKIANAAEAASKDPSAAEDLVEAQRELESLPVRALETFEHPRFLRDALQMTQNRLLIISPWIRSAVVDDTFVASVDTLVRRGVTVLLGWGISGPGGETADGDARARTALARIAERYNNFKFKYLGNTHAKILLSDTRFVIVTSFNWLSYRGDPSRTFRDERGILVALPDEIDRHFDTLRQQFA